MSRLHLLGKELARGFLQLIYPGMCAACSQPLADGAREFCPACRAGLTADPYPSCARCGSTVGPYVPLEDGCMACRTQTFAFDAVLRMGPYEGLLRDLILRVKHATGEALAEMLGALWAEHAEAPLRALGAHVVIPVPLHWWRRWTRGYNQSEALAHALASRLHLPCHDHYLRRVRNTPSQVQQAASYRRENVRQAFRARPRPELHNKTVLLVDDVLTTGSTASEAAKAVRSAGAARVVVAVLAHSQR